MMTTDPVLIPFTVPIFTASSASSEGTTTPTTGVPSQLPLTIPESSQYQLANSDAHRVAQAVTQIIGHSTTSQNPIIVGSIGEGTLQPSEVS